LKVYFESSGGFTGMDNSTVIDTELTNSEDAQQLRKLVMNSNFFDLPSESSRPKPGSADYIAYKITVESEGQSHTVRTNDISMPPKLSTLIRFLQSKSKIDRHF
jgi:hypothetical protein